MLLPCLVGSRGVECVLTTGRFVEMTGNMLLECLSLLESSIMRPSEALRPTVGKSVVRLESSIPSSDPVSSAVRVVGLSYQVIT